MARSIATLRRSRTVGATVLEATVSLVILSAVVTAVAETLVLVNHVRQSMHRHQLATQEAANVLERLLASDWDELAADSVPVPELSPDVHDILPASKLRVDIVSTAGEPAALRIFVALGWENSAGEFIEPVQLTGWKYRLRRTP